MPTYIIVHTPSTHTLHQVHFIDAATLTSVIEYTLLRMNMSVAKCCGQCYDGARNMTGAKRGVATNNLAKEQRDVFTHCYGHAFNLAVCDCVRQCKLPRHIMDTIHEVSKLIRLSPERDNILKRPCVLQASVVCWLTSLCCSHCGRLAKS